MYGPMTTLDLQALTPNALQCNVIPGKLDYTGIYIRYRIHSFIYTNSFIINQ